MKQGRSNDSTKKKLIIALKLDGNNEVKRAYFQKSSDYYSKELITIFERHTSKQAHVITDKWTDYKPMRKDDNITQIKSNSSDFFLQ